MTLAVSLSWGLISGGLAILVVLVVSVLRPRQPRKDEVVDASVRYFRTLRRRKRGD